LATPHFVKTSSILSAAALKVIKTKKETDERWRNVESGTVSRETLALFLQVSLSPSRFFSLVRQVNGEEGS
jgi:hypothetical protein